jgi:hypothetical protein
VNPALLLIAALEPSPLAIDAHLMLGSALMQESGELPTIASTPEFDRYCTWIHFRGGIVDSQPNTPLGTQLGFEFEVRLGFTPDEAKELHDALPLGFAAAVGISMRTFTFNVPFLGMIVPHLSAELGAGGAHWWSDTARLSVLGGVRAAIGNEDGVSLEADYTLVPFVVTGSPGELRVKNLEHRVAVSIGAGPIGLAVWIRFSRQRWKLSADEDFSTTNGRAIGVGLEWRP